MKRMIVLIITIFLGVAAKGQVTSSMMLMYSPFGDNGVIASETTGIGENHIGYGYIEMGDWRGHSFGAYGQFFWEQRWWDLPVFLHAEYRAAAGLSFFESTAYLGGAYCFYSQHGYLAIEPLAMWRQRGGFGGQLSIVGGWEWKHFQIETFNDLWKTHLTNVPAEFYSQTRLFVKITEKLALGIIGTLDYPFEGTPDADAMITLRWRL